MIEFMKKCKGDQRYLLDKERRILENNYSKQDVIDVIWTYEGVFTLMWAIDYKADKYEYDVSQICSGDAVIFDMRSIAERRRALEWLISDENDWFNIDLNT